MFILAKILCGVAIRCAIGPGKNGDGGGAPAPRSRQSPFTGTLR